MKPPEPRSAHSEFATKDQRICPVTGRVLTPRPERRWLAWLGSGMGLASLVWFLIRVIPKPSRALYPCQRIAFPVASSFVTWLALVLGSAFAWRKRYARLAPQWRTFLWTAAALVGATLTVAYLPTLRATAGPNPLHGPLGAAKGIFPGRVAWVYAPQ